MKAFFAVAAALLISPLASAETKLACWNMYSAKGAKPILTADIKAAGVLSNVNIDVKDSLFDGYAYDKTETVPAGTSIQKSEIHSPTVDLTPEEITVSVYKGKNKYAFDFGTNSWAVCKTPDDCETHPYNYSAKIVLPKDLSNDNLKVTRLRSPTERSNAVMIYSPIALGDQGGDNYLRMFCVSK